MQGSDNAAGPSAGSVGNPLLAAIQPPPFTSLISMLQALPLVPAAATAPGPCSVDATGCEPTEDESADSISTDDLFPGLLGSWMATLDIKAIPTEANSLRRLENNLQRLEQQASQMFLRFDGTGDDFPVNDVLRVAVYANLERRQYLVDAERAWLLLRAANRKFAKDTRDYDVDSYVQKAAELLDSTLLELDGAIRIDDAIEELAGSARQLLRSFVLLVRIEIDNGSSHAGEASVLPADGRNESERALSHKGEINGDSLHLGLTLEGGILRRGAGREIELTPGQEAAAVRAMLKNRGTNIADDMMKRLIGSEAGRISNLRSRLNKKLKRLGVWIPDREWLIEEFDVPPVVRSRKKARKTREKNVPNLGQRHR